MQNSKIGLLLESYSSVDFKNHAKEYDLSYEAVYYSNHNDMEKALENTLVDGESVKVMVTHSTEEKFTPKWWTSGNSILILINEYLKIVGYWFKGYI